MIGALRNHPSIVMWVPFNEGWGQHDTEKYVGATEGARSHAPRQQRERLDRYAASATSSTATRIPGRRAGGRERAARRSSASSAVSGCRSEGHTWLEKGNWGYRSFTTPADLGKAYRDLMTQLRLQIANGAAAAIYTQTTDVEIEVNGLMTYDRAVTKLPAAQSSQPGTPPSTSRRRR